MPRYLHIAHWVFIFALMSSFMVFAPQAQAQAAFDHTYVVDIAKDPRLGSTPIAGACVDPEPPDDPILKNCSLREAILLANSDGGTSLIKFELPADQADSDYNFDPAGYWSITPRAELPHITAPGTMIDGLQTDNISQIVFDGTVLSQSQYNGPGLTIENTSGTIIKGISVVNFRGTTLLTGIGIHITGSQANANQIVNCYIGVNAKTQAAGPNEKSGILIGNNAYSNYIGTRTARNVISGNDGNGITLSSTTGNTIQNNLIGVIPKDVNSLPMPNLGYGIEVSNSSGNIIGALDDIEKRNIISNNGKAGIVLDGSDSQGNYIYGNYIGTTRVGAEKNPNGANGIQIFNGARNNILSGSRTVRLLISGNTGYGVFIRGGTTFGNTISNAYIGLAVGGTAAIPNTTGGVRIEDDAYSNSIGTASAGNVISGNTGYGISIGRTQDGYVSSTANSIIRNIIGLNSTGEFAVPNTVGGILLDSSAKNTVIGGTTTLGNIISANGSNDATTPSGIVIRELDVGNTTIAGNTIGMKRSALNGPYTAAAGNAGGGIYVESKANTVTIGGNDVTAKNKIAYNLGDGVQVNLNATNIKITYNEVTTNTLNGINLTGVAAPIITDNQANANGTATPGTGILVSAAPNAQILRNTAKLNRQHGISVSDSANLQLNNNTALSNYQNGIQLISVDFAQINTNTADSNGYQGADSFTQNGIYINGAYLAKLDSTSVNKNKANGLFILNGDAISASASTATLNLNSGVVVGNATRITLNTTKALTNTLNGISLVNVQPFTVTNSLSRANKTGAGLKSVESFSHSQILNNEFSLNGSRGITLESVAPAATQYLTMTGNLVQKNTGSGLYMNGNINNALIQQNRFYFNTVDGVHIGGANTPHPQQVNINNNSFTGNGIPANATLPVNEAYYGLGIVIEPGTIGAGVATNPNHDIDPPFNLTAWDDGRFTGRVLADGSTDACLPVPVTPAPDPAPACTVQLFSTDSERLDGQGFSLINSSPVGDNGYFTATLGFVPKQMVATATDEAGNTSEFSLFNANPKLSIDSPQAQFGSPGETITYTHHLTNTGNVGFSGIGLGFEARKNGVLLLSWDVTADPAGTFSLAPGQSKVVTVTVKLPLGPNDEIAAGTVGSIRLVASSGSTPNGNAQVEVIDSLTVLPRVVLDVQPTALNGSAKPGQTVVYPHTVTNLGNVATTVNISSQTVVDNGNAPTWATVIEPTSLTLEPGQSAGFAVKVTVSQGAQLNTQALTTITVVPSVNGTPDTGRQKTVIDTTIATLEQAASLVPPSLELPGAAAEVTTFQHCATNLSNGTATFKLQAISSQGSIVTFADNDPVYDLINGNTFTIAQGAQFCFFVNVNVDRRLLPGQKDIVTIVLLNEQGGVLGGASAQDTVLVQTGVMYPRVYLPIIFN